MKVLVIGDSIGLPRFHHLRDEVEAYYEDTYPERLRCLLVKRFPGEDVQVLNRSVHANTTRYLRKGAANEVLFFCPEFLVLELGMADLWPRVTNPALDGTGTADEHWVGIGEFEASVAHFLDFCRTFPEMHTIIVTIPRARQDQYSKYPAALERTEAYNRILQGLVVRPRVSVVDAYELFANLGEHAHGSDGIHPSLCASRLLAEQLMKEILAVRLGCVA